MGGAGFCSVCIEGNLTLATGEQPITIANVCTSLPIINGLVTIDVAALLAELVVPPISSNVIASIAAEVPPFRVPCLEATIPVSISTSLAGGFIAVTVG
ncbi:hypothetical protein [Ammoniphilus sp. 3BR4]|uniref:hypothetical protein n=1 Tax=Ammoniphilus sp. 3BR4 TaxID=3158265 RepID=UPI003466D401